MTSATCSPSELVAMWSAVAERIAGSRDDLNHLDRMAGDGDHGENMQRGLSSAVRQVTENPPADLAESFRFVGNVLIADVAGSAGFLFGNAVLKAGNALADAPVLDAGAIARALSAATDIIQRRGKASRGDKTMLDALLPALDAVNALPADAPLQKALAAAAEGARAGADQTAALIASKGRASYVGDRSLGQRDPGAVSASLILSAIADWAAANGEGR